MLHSAPSKWTPIEELQYCVGLGSVFCQNLCGVYSTEITHSTRGVDSTGSIDSTVQVVQLLLASGAVLLMVQLLLASGADTVDGATTLG
jgi:hypothetical protein